MGSPFLIGVGAGLVSALLTLVIATGSSLSLMLFFLAPLPIAVVALGWNHKTGLVAVVVAATTLALAPLAFGGGVNLRMAAVFGVSTFLPAWWFSYLTLLARPAAPPATESEWYPVGRVLAWIAGIVAAVTVAGVATISMDYAEYVRAFGRAVDLLERINPDLFSRLPIDARPQARADIAQLVAAFAPPISAAISVLISAGLLAVAGRVTMASGRLPRPWPWLPGIVLPKALLPAFAAAMIGSALDGFVGLAFRTLFAALAAAYALQGFATTHALTTGKTGRGAMLGALYALCILLGGWPLLLVALLGVADALFNIRARRGLTPPQGT